MVKDIPSKGNSKRKEDVGVKKEKYQAQKGSSS